MEFSFSFSLVPSWEFIAFLRDWLTVERTGEYVAHDDHIPLSGSGDLMKDKLLGISIADFAIAIVDEAETEEHVFQHWTVTGSLEDDNPTPSYLTI
jgi:putative NADH-flavin reductase